MNRIENMSIKPRRLDYGQVSCFGKIVEPV